MAEPFAKERDGLCAMPSTAMVTVPMGVVVTELQAEATVMLITSFAPGATLLVAAEGVVVEGIGEVQLVQALSRL